MRWEEGAFVWADSGEPTGPRECPECGELPVFCEECGCHHDACLGHLEGVVEACCGHGDPAQDYRIGAH